MNSIMRDNTREFYGWVAAILSSFLFLCPVKSFKNLFKKAITLENSPAFSVTVNYINNICWYIYGDMLLSRQLKFCHLFGMIFNFIFIFIYLFFEIRIYPIDAILNGLIIIIGTYALYRGFTVILEDEEAVGNICMGTQFIALLPPFVLIIKVLRQKNYNLIPIYFVWVSLSSTISWIAYGVQIFNTNIILPNIGGFIFGVGLVIIYIVLSGQYKIINELKHSDTIEIENNDNNIIGETNINKTHNDSEKKKKKPIPIKISNSEEED